MSKLEHEPCLTQGSLACTLHLYFRVLGSTPILHRRPARAAKLTEDPPFGGLWCDQPAIFLFGRIACGDFSRPDFRRLRRLSPLKRASKSVDERHERIEIHGLRDVQIEASVDSGFDISARCVPR